MSNWITSIGGMKDEHGFIKCPISQWRNNYFSSSTIINVMWTLQNESNWQPLIKYHHPLLIGSTNNLLSTFQHDLQTAAPFTFVFLCQPVVLKIPIDQDHVNNEEENVRNAIKIMTIVNTIITIMIEIDWEIDHDQDQLSIRVIVKILF